MKTCKKPGCNYPVFGKGYCKSHQYLRPELKRKIRPISDHQQKRLQSYNKVKKTISYGKCFFCDMKISEVDKYKPHHLVPRSYAPELFDHPNNLVATHWGCHKEFHDMPHSSMRFMPWYTQWLHRISLISQEYHQLMLTKTS